MYKVYRDELSHYGIKGMRKGRRRWTNEDGSLTEAGKQRYGIKDAVSSTNSRAGVSGGISSSNSRAGIGGVISSTHSRTGLGGGVSSINSRYGARGAISSAGSRVGIRGGVSAMNSRDGIRGAVSTTHSRAGLRSGISSANSREGVRRGVSSANSRVGVSGGISSSGSRAGVRGGVASSNSKSGIRGGGASSNSKAGVSGGVYSINSRPGTKHHINNFITKFRSRSLKSSVHRATQVRHSDDSDELNHYGIHGQKWRVRRYQEYDGSLTPAGRTHYGVGPAREGGSSGKSALKTAERTTKKLANKVRNKIREKRIDREGVRLAKKARGRGYKKMGDKDLDKVINRLNLEKRYRDLKRDEPAGKAKTLAYELFKDTMKKVVPNTANLVSTTSMKKYLDDKNKQAHDKDSISLTKKAKKGGYKKMGDSDLNKVVDRINLEKKYEDLEK